MGENAHLVLGIFFIIIFLIGLLPGIYEVETGDTTIGTFTLGSCTVIGLIPGVSFLSFWAKLLGQRTKLENLGRFLAARERSTVAEVATQFNWTEQDAEDNVVAALAENTVAGNFDRGSGQFFTETSMRDMEFVARCDACGAVVGMWVWRHFPAKCPYCGGEPRSGFTPPRPYGQNPQTAGAGIPYPQYTPQTPPTPAMTPGYISPYPEGAPPPPPAMERGRRTVPLLFFSIESGLLEIAGVLLLALAMVIVAISVVISLMVETNPFVPVLVYSIFYLPPLLLGCVFISRAFREKKYRDDLIDVVDFIETYRRIGVDLLARKMALPEESVRKMIGDMLDFRLVDGYMNPDGREFIVRLRPEDVKTVRVCPNCKNATLNLRVLRGGSVKCPFCSGLTYFPEGD